jgi:DNA repair protein RadA/Sms
MNLPLSEKILCFGEVGLSGEVRAVSMAQNRVQEAKKLGFTACIMPQANIEALPAQSGLQIIGVRNIYEAVNEMKKLK